MPSKNKELIREYAKGYRERNCEKHRLICQQYRKDHKDALNEYAKKYRKSPKGRYIEQKTQAKQRGVEWRLSFEEWYTFWLDSGHWEERGSGKWMMCRFADTGPYSLENIRIDNSLGNNRERWALGKLSQV